jgi:hypothetical protein
MGKGREGRGVEKGGCSAGRCPPETGLVLDRVPFGVSGLG